MQKTILALLFGAAAAFQAPHQARASVVVQADRRSFLEGLAPAAAVAAALAPAAASAAKPPQLQSMTPPRREKTGQIKTGNAGSIMKK